MWILSFNQIGFPVAGPLLHGLLALDRIGHQLEILPPHKTRAAILRAEAGKRPVSMFVRPSREVAGHADIDRAVLSVRDHVDGDDPVATDQGWISHRCD